MSKNGGFLDVVWDDLISRRGLSLCPHPKQVVLQDISFTFQGDHTEIAPVIGEYMCSCWKCHPEEIPEKEEGVGIVSIRREGRLETRFWKTTLDGQPCGFVKEAKPGRNGYVWLARTPPHACSCKSGYTCTIILHGTVTVEPDGDDY
jgi:hypothetical protein